VGTVTGLVREQAGWERVYRLLPAANPGSAAHVLVLVSSPGRDLAAAFPSDSALEAQRLDSIARIRRADSLAQAAREAKASRADSLAAAAVSRDTTRPKPLRRAVRSDSIPPPRPPPAPVPPARGDSAR
jgi:hypothetical protein